MKIMAKIKELLEGREKLARYDELKKFKHLFDYPMLELIVPCPDTKWDIPEHIRAIIVAALEAEIKKLDEE